MMWIGIEKEGKYKSYKTLFIASPDVTFDKIEKIVQQHKDIKQIYFGAGLCSEINWNLAHQCKKLHNYVIITIEMELSKFCKLDKANSKFFNFMLTINNKCLENLNYKQKYRYQLKLQSLDRKKVIMTSPLERFSFVDVKLFKKKNYHGDVIIE